MSLFSGIGGFDLGLERSGWQCVAQADNDPFCNKVLAKHWPGVKRYDDVRNVGLREPLCEERAGRTVTDRAAVEGAVGRDGQGRRGTVDLICGGFPCQDLSVAGKRAGLDGARSGLWFEFHRILSELRPTFCLIENVPGLLSSNSGRDFGVILGGLGELGYVVGWRILDSQYWGVAQRRRRVYVIGGPSRASVQQILSLCESGDWNTQTRRAQGEDVAGTLAAGAHPSGFNGRDAESGSLVAFGGNRTSGSIEVAAAVNAHGGTGRSDFESETFLVAPPITAGDGDKWGSNQWVDEGKAVVGVGVRRLTPVECERLQGLPDNWTRLDDKTPDGPRYKALGNAVTVPVIEYLGHRIKAVLNG